LRKEERIMKRITLLSIATLVVACCFAVAAFAQGALPSPFKDRIDAVTVHVKVLGKLVEEQLGVPPDPVNPGEVRRAVVKLHAIAGALAWLARSTSHSTFAIMSDGTVLSWGSNALGQLENQGRKVNKIIKSIDEFLSVPPDPIAPEFNGALRNLRAEAEMMLKDIKRFIRKLEELLSCTESPDCGCNGELVPCSDFTTESDCTGQFGCYWNDTPGAPPYCAPTDMVITQCSDISYEQCNNRSGCYTMNCIDGICQE
jgi:hypothetical protein